MSNYIVEGNGDVDSWDIEKIEKKPRKDYGLPSLIGTCTEMNQIILKRIKDHGVTSNKFFDLFQEVEFFDRYRSYAAIEFAFDYFNSKSGIVEEICDQRIFLYCAKRNVGVMKNFIVYYGAHGEKVTLDNDYCGRGVSYSGSRSSISAFFTKHPGSLLAVSVGNRAHDTLIFMRKVGRSYEFIHYNPNFNERLYLAERVMSGLSKTGKIRGYSADGWNVEGWCSAYVWTEVFKLLRTNYDPFQREGLTDWCKRLKIWMYSMDIIGEMEEEVEYRAKAKQRYIHENEDDRPIIINELPEKKKRKRGI